MVTMLRIYITLKSKYYFYFTFITIGRYEVDLKALVVLFGSLLSIIRTEDRAVLVAAYDDTYVQLSY